MNTSSASFGAIEGNSLRVNSAQASPDRPLDAAWIVLEAANDLADHVTVEICRRVIDANLNGKAPAPADVHVITEYFR